MIADPLLRFLGLGAGGLVAFALVWGVRFVLHRGEERVWARSLALIPAVGLGAVTAAAHAPPAFWPLPLGLGGMLGDAGLARLLALLPVPPADALMPAGFGLGLATAAVWALALGLTRGEAAVCLGWLGGSLASAAGRLSRAWRRTARPATRPEPAPRTPPGRGLRPSVARPDPGPGNLAAGPETALGTAIRALRTGERPCPAADLPAATKFGRMPERRGADTAEDGQDDEDDETLRPDRDAPRPVPAAYDAPPLGLLTRPDRDLGPPVSDEELDRNARQLETVLADYGVRGEITAVRAGPVVTLYELEPAPGLKASRVIGLSDDIARSMSALSARVSTVPGRTVIGIELPNDTRQRVLLREVLEAPDYRETHHPLALALGKSIEGNPVVANLARMPHLLIAGTTGFGQVGGDQHDDPELLYRLPPGPLPAHHDRPQDAGAQRL